MTDTWKDFFIKEAVTFGLNLGILGTAAVGAPFIMWGAEQGSYKAAPWTFSFSYGDLEKVVSLGLTTTAIALRLTPARMLGFKWDGMDKEVGQILFSVAANCLLAPASLAYSAAILDVDFSARDDFYFGYLSPIVGGAMIGLAGTAVFFGGVGCLYLKEKGCCINMELPSLPSLPSFPRFPSLPNFRSGNQGEIDMEAQPQPIADLEERRFDRPVLPGYSNAMQDSNPDKDLIPPAASVAEDVERRSPAKPASSPRS